MKKSTLLLIVAIFFAGLMAGSYLTKKQYVKRSLELPEKDCFSNQDIEHILFNEPI